MIQSSLLKVESTNDKSHLFLLQIHLKSHLGISKDNLIDIHAHFMIYKTKTLVHNELPSLDKKYIYFTLFNETSLQWFFLLNSTQPNHSDYKIFSLFKTTQDVAPKQFFWQATTSNQKYVIYSIYLWARWKKFICLMSSIS